MTFEEFRRRAEEIFASIPEEYREGVEGVEPLRKTIPHDSIPDVYTLGECLSEQYPTDFGGPGEVRSRVVLYYGSFLELSRDDDDFDWEEELFETVTHEVRHHLEHLALDDALEEVDYAVDQNFARRDGDRFDPFFFRSGEPLGPDTFEVDGDVFIERTITPAEFERLTFIPITWKGERLSVAPPLELGDVHFARVEDVDLRGGRDLYVVLVRRRGAWDWLRALTGGDRLQVLESSVSRVEVPS